MTTLNDFNFTDDVDDVRAAHVNALQAAALRSEYRNSESLSADRDLLDADTPIQVLDPDGGDYDVLLPSEDAVENHPYLIRNGGSSGTLTVKSNDEATTHAVLAAGEFAFLLPDGDGEYVLVGSVSPSNLVSADGWTAVSDSWSYASINTINVPSGADSIYAVGDIIKLTANGVVLYVYVVGVASTLLTVAGNALTNHAFSNIYYSKKDSPVGFPGYFSHSITAGGFSSAPNLSSTYSISGRTLTMMVTRLADGVSNATTFTIDLPVAAAEYAKGIAFGQDNSAYTFATWNVYPSSSTVSLYKNQVSNWTASGNKSISCVIICRI